jgi:hypothetical protein
MNRIEKLIKPGSVGKAVCGYDIKIFNEKTEVAPRPTRICGYQIAIAS